MLDCIQTKTGPWTTPVQLVAFLGREFTYHVHVSLLAWNLQSEGKYLDEYFTMHNI